MTALALLALFLVLALGIGRRVLDLLRAPTDGRLERTVISIALGLGVMAYAVLGVGLAGWLGRAPVAATLAVLGVLCLPGFAAAFRDLWRAPVLKAAPQSPAEPARSRKGRASRGGDAPAADPGKRPGWLPAAAVGVALAALGGIALVGCFVPPAGHEWDTLSYHLAVPKVYLAEGRIGFLPTDHHSNFPFLVQMLYTLGLLYQGWALANLFHWACGALCVAGAWAIGRRVAPGVGPAAALVTASAPIVVWEASTAYIDLGFALYTLMAAGAVVAWRYQGNARSLWLAGVLMGFALSVKTLALVPMALLGLMLAAMHAPLRHVAAYAGLALVVGCPFYVKSAAHTGNPVYPFAYRIFGGRYWNAEMAEAYAGEQRSFGLSRSQPTVADELRGTRPAYAEPSITDRVRNLLMAPFALVGMPALFYNYNDPGEFSYLGFLFLALPPLLLLGGRASPAGRICAGLALLWYAAWAMSMQYVRYIIPLLPLLGVAGGEGAAWWARHRPWVGRAAWAAAALQVLLTVAYFAPKLTVNYLPRVTAAGLEMAPYPGQWQLATDPDARERYLERSVSIYEAQRWLNESAPRDAGVILYEDTRGFYLDRPYLWGNSPHSLFIPYTRFGSGREMVQWFTARGYRYALLNLQYAPQAAAAEGQERLREAVGTGAVEPLIREWYGTAPTGEPWRRLLGDALRTGHAVVLPHASTRAAAVMEFRSLPEGEAR